MCVVISVYRLDTSFREQKDMYLLFALLSHKVLLECQLWVQITATSSPKSIITLPLHHLQRHHSSLHSSPYKCL